MFDVNSCRVIYWSAMILSNAHFVWMLISRLQNLQCLFNAANFISFFCTYDMQDVWKFNMECPLIIREFSFRFFTRFLSYFIKARILIKVLRYLFYRKAEVFTGLCIQRDIQLIWIVLQLRLNRSCKLFITCIIFKNEDIYSEIIV